MAYKHKKIKLWQLTYNSDYQIVGDIVIKLTYEPLEETKPKIEIFKNTQATEQNECIIYGYSGPTFDEKGDKLMDIITFKQAGEIKLVLVGDEKYEIKFIQSGKEKYSSSKTGTQEVPFYEFLVSSIE